MKHQWSYGLLTLALCSCASVTVTHVAPGDVSSGVHFNRSRPYLLISKQIKAASQKITKEETKTEPATDLAQVEKAPKTAEKTTSTKGATTVVKATSEDVAPTVEYTSKIVYLPDPSQEYTVELHSGIGSAHGSVKLVDGWMLAEFGGTADSKATDLASTAATLAGTVITATAAAAAPAEGLYRIDIAPDGAVKLNKQSWYP